MYPYPYGQHSWTDRKTSLLVRPSPLALFDESLSRVRLTTLLVHCWVKPKKKKKIIFIFCCIYCIFLNFCSFWWITYIDVTIFYPVFRIGWNGLFCPPSLSPAKKKNKKKKTKKKQTQTSLLSIQERTRPSAKVIGRANRGETGDPNHTR